MRTLRVAAIGAAIVLSLAACSGSSSPAASAAASTAASAGGGGAAPCAKGTDAGKATVTIKDFKFDPTSVTVKVGEGVAFSNQDTTAHTATLLDNSCGTESIAAGSSVTLTFTKAGTYQYHCTIHSSMPTATVVVES